MRPPVDPEILAVLDQVPPQRCWAPESMRADGERLLSSPTVPPDGIRREVVHIPGPGGDLELRMHHPRSEPRAVVLSVHGGGFVAGRAAYDDGWNAILAQTSGALVVSPDYRLAPEHPFPAALADCLAGWEWILSRYPDRRRVVYGDSAGGNLAASLTLWTMDHGLPVPDEALLIEPVLDDRLETPSMVWPDTPVWNRRNARASWDAYLGGRGAEAFAAPARREDLTGHPRTFLLANQCDPLLDEDLSYARRLCAQGALTELMVTPGGCHGLLGLNGPRIADESRRTVLDRLRDACDRDPQALRPPGTAAPRPEGSR